MMYWRVRKVTPEQLLKMYGVHIILGLSLFANFILFMSRPKSTIAADKKADYTTFVKAVTTHLLDTSYISYMQSTTMLTQELDGPLLARLKKDGTMPATMEEVKASQMNFQKTRRVSAIQFNSVELKDLLQNGMLPVDVQGTVAVHSADESAQQPFHFMFVVGVRGTDPPSPVIFDFKDLPPATAAGAPPAESSN